MKKEGTYVFVDYEGQSRQEVGAEIFSRMVASEEEKEVRVETISVEEGNLTTLDASLQERFEEAESILVPDRELRRMMTGVYGIPLEKVFNLNSPPYHPAKKKERENLEGDIRNKLSGFVDEIR